MGSKSNGQVSGYRYYMTLLLGLGRGPIDSVYQIMAAGLVAWDGSVAYVLDTDTTYQGAVTTTTENIPLQEPDLFGGDQGQGGLDGYFNVYMGDADQAPPGAVEAQMEIGPISGLRGVTTLMYVGQVTANSPYLQTMKFRIRRAVKGWQGDTPWYPEKAVIMMSDGGIATFTDGSTVDGDSYTAVVYTGGDTTTMVTDNTGNRTYVTYSPVTGESSATAVPLAYNSIAAMNPAHIVYEACTNPDWGRGLDPSLMDNLSFTQCANTLFDENFGLCLKWSRTDTVDSFIQTVIDHIGAIVYTDRVTGLLGMRLIRADYDPTQLPVFDYTSGLIAVVSVDTAAQDSIFNEVIVNYQTPVLDAAAQARAQNIGSINALGCVFSITKQYPGIPTTNQAIVVAQRDLKSLGSGMKRVQVKLDRRAFLMVSGDVFIVNSPDRGLNNIVLRALTVEDSVVTDGTITVTAGQDVFGLPETPFVQPQQSTWLEPNTYPVTIQRQCIQECNYRDLRKVLPDTTVDHSTNYIMVLAQAPTGSSISFDIWGTETVISSSHIPPYQLEKSGGMFIGVSALVGSIATTDTVITVKPLDRRFNLIQPGQCLYFGNNSADATTEFVVLQAMVTNADGSMTLTIGRGCVDTPAYPHGDGNLLWAYDQTYAVNTFEAQIADYVAVRLLTRTLRGVLPINAANEMDYSIGYSGVRQEMPYCGSNFRVNGFPRDATPPLSGSIVFTWNHRNRLLQDDTLVDELAASVSPEAGTSYAIMLSNVDKSNDTYWLNTTDDTATFDPSDMPSWTNVTLKCYLFTQRTDSQAVGGAINAISTPSMTFSWSASSSGGGTTGPVPTTGWNYNFGNDFGGA